MKKNTKNLLMGAILVLVAYMAYSYFFGKPAPEGFLEVKTCQMDSDCKGYQAGRIQCINKKCTPVSKAT